LGSKMRLELNEARSVQAHDGPSIVVRATDKGRDARNNPVTEERIDKVTIVIDGKRGNLQVEECFTSAGHSTDIYTPYAQRTARKCD
jgi:hypothetical protein